MFCGVGEDRSSWRVSGSRWPWTHHWHEAFDAAPTPAQGFSRKTCLKGTTLWSKCFRPSRAAAAEMMVPAEVPRMAVHSATVARRKIWNQMPRKLVVPSHLGRRQISELRQAETQLCCDVVMSIAKELTPLLLGDTSWLPEVYPDVIVNVLLPQHLWSASIHMSSQTSRTVTGAQCTWFISFGPLDCAGRYSSRGRCAGGSSRGSVPVPGCSVVSRRRAPQGRALAPSLLIARWVDGCERMRTSRLLRRLS